MNFIIFSFVLSIFIVFIVSIKLNSKSDDDEFININNSSNLGLKGEILVNNLLEKTLLQLKEYYLLNNITYEVNNTVGSSQIDHILISPYGIFIIETKHYSGNIIGGSKQFKWASIYRYKNGFKKIYYFLNPLRQNYTHVKVVDDLIKNIKSEEFHSIIVFTGSAKLQNDRIENILYLDELIAYICKYNKKTISKSQFYESIGILEHHRLKPSKLTEINHINNIKKKRNRYKL
jgi:hypothetical protein